MAKSPKKIEKEEPVEKRRPRRSTKDGMTRRYVQEWDGKKWVNV